MRRNFWIQVQNYMRKAKFRRKVRNILAMLAVVTVFTTTYALILPAITLENSVPLAGFDANEGKTPEELAAEAERQAAAEAAAAEESGNGVVDADPASFVGSDGIFGEDGQNPAADGETPPPTPPDSVEVSGEVSGEFSSDNTDYPSIEGFTMNAEGRVFDPVGNEIDPARLSEAQRQSLLEALQNRTAEEALANYHMNGAGQVLDANEQPVDPSGLSTETLKALEQKYIDEVLSLYHMDKDGQILDALNQPQDPATFSAAALVALREKSQSDAAMSAGEDNEKEPGSHDLSLYKMLDNGRIVSEDGTEIPADRFSEEELDSLKKAWSERVLAEYSIDENGEVKNAQGETIDSSAFPEELLLALRQKAADSSEALPYALKMYMDEDLVIKDGFTHEPVSEEKLNELSAQLRDILYGFEVNYDARLEAKDRYTAGLRAQGLDAQAESVANSAAPMAEVGRQQALAANAQQIAAGEAALDAEVQVELAQALEQVASAEGGQQAPAGALDELENSTDASETPCLSASRRTPLSAPAQAPAMSGNSAPIMRTPNPPIPPQDLNPAYNTLKQNPPQPYYFYTKPENQSISGFVRIAVDPFIGQNNPGTLSYVYPTGYLTKLKFSFSNADGALDRDTVRIYLKADQVDPQNPLYTAPGALILPHLGPNGSDLSFMPKSVANPYGPGILYYYDISGIPSAATGIANTYINYKNGSLGGNTTVWAEKFTGKNPGDPDYTRQPASTASYLNIPHVTEPRNQQVAKKSRRDPSFTSIPDEGSYVTGLSFTVNDFITSSREFFDNFGELNYVHSQDQPDIATDTLILPEGLEFRAASLGSIEQIRISSKAEVPKDIKGVPENLNTPGTLLITNLNGQRYLVAFMQETRSTELDYAYELSQNGQQLVVTAKAWYKTAQPADKLPLWNSSSPLNYQLGEQWIKFKQEPQPGSAEQIITNQVQYTMHLQDGQVQNSNDQVTVNLKPKTAHLTIKKSADAKQAPEYYGEQAGWQISVKNDSTYVYNKLQTLKDRLSPNLYLSWDNLYQLFNAPAAFDGQGYPTVTIRHADLVTTPSGTVPNASGNGSLNQDAQHHGVETPYNGLAEKDPDIKARDLTLTITREDESVRIEAKNGSGQTISSTTLLLSSLQGKGQTGHFDFPDGKSYIVTHWAQYEIAWPYQQNGENFIFQGGVEHNYRVPTTVKDSFMLLEADRKNYYPDERIWVTNDAAGSFESGTPEDRTIDNSEAQHPQAKREASIIKGQEKDVKTSGIGSFIIIAKHSGHGAPEVLTITDHVRQDFVDLLVRVDDNPGQIFKKTIHNDSDNMDYGLIKNPGTYYFRMTDGQKILGVVSTLSDGSKLIKWHFDRTTVGTDFDKTIKVLTYVDPKSGYSSRAYVNETWMNDHATHRIYDSVQHSPLYDFDKKIVTQKAEGSPPNPENDHLTDFSRLVQGQKVLYRLELWGDPGVSLTKDDIFDRLPETPDGFMWKTSDVRIVDQQALPRSTSVTMKDLDQFNVSSDKPDGSHQQLHWTAEGNLLTFIEPNASAYIYLELTYPGDDETWQAYEQTYGNRGIDNFFHVYEGERSVHHSLASAQLCQLGKSVVSSDIVKSRVPYFNRRAFPYMFIDPMSYWNSPYYAYLPSSGSYDWGDKTSYVFYTVSITNPSGDNLYLNDIRDTLPEGFRYAGLATQDTLRNDEYRVENDSLTYCRASTGFHKVPANEIFYRGKPYLYELENNFKDYEESPDSTDDIKEYTVSQISEDRNNPVFRITDIHNGTLLRANASVTNTTNYQDAKGWYLPPHSALAFTYRVTVDEFAKTSETAENRVSMDYMPPYQDMTPELPAEGDVEIKGLHYRDIISNVQNGRHELSQNADKTYTLSSVTSVKREPTQIGISKRYTGTFKGEQALSYPEGDPSLLDNEGYYEPQEQLTWSVELKHKSGVAQDWSLTETMQQPYGFDEIRFYPQAMDEIDLHQPVGYTGDLCYVFSIKENTNGVFKVTLKRPAFYGIEDCDPVSKVDGQWIKYGTQTGTLRLGGSLDLGDGVPGGTTPNFHIEIRKDAQGNQQLTLTPEKGYFGYSYAMQVFDPGKETVERTVDPPFPRFLIKTSNHSQTKADPKLYRNTARLTPTVPIVHVAAEAGHYEGGDQPSVVDGANAPVFGSKGTMSNKSVTELDPTTYQPVEDNGKTNTATGNPLDYTQTNNEPNVISLPKAETPVRYTLRVKNLSTEIEDNAKIDDLVLVDNLPQINDTRTWRSDTPRGSQFQLNLADQNDHPMTVIIQDYDASGAATGPARTLTQGKDYVIEYSDECFLAGDAFKNKPAPGWYATPTASTRSFRLRTLKTDDAKMAIHAVLELSFDAVVDKSFKPSKDDQIAWNSFGYRYHMVANAPEEFLEAEPEVVGVKLPGVQIPSLQKQRLYQNDAFPVTPSEPAVSDGTTGDQLSYLFLVLDQQTSYTHDMQNGTALTHLKNNLQAQTDSLAMLQGKTLNEVRAMLLNALGSGSSGTFSQQADTYQLYSVPVTVGQSSGWIPMNPETAPDDPNTTVGVTLDPSRAYVVLELMNPRTGKPYVIKADGKIYDDDATEPQSFSDNQGGTLTRQYLTTSAGSYPVYYWTPKADNTKLAELVLTGSNKGKPWSINLLKTKGSSEKPVTPGSQETQPEPLLGAIFALYSPLPNEEMPASEVIRLQKLYNFADPLSGTYLDDNGKTYYLTAISAGDQPGTSQPFDPRGKTLAGANTGWDSARPGDLQTTARFENLRANEYVLRELRAPKGYKFSTLPIHLQRSTYYADAGVKLPGGGTGSYPATIDNNEAWALVSNEIEAGDVMPETGGIGRWPFLLGGLFFLLVAGAGLWVRRRQALEAAPQSRR